MNACRDLKALHEQLVVGGIISEAEFWRHRQHLLRQQAQDHMHSRQKPGLSNAMIEQNIDASSNKASLPSGPQDFCRHVALSAGATVTATFHF